MARRDKARPLAGLKIDSHNFAAQAYSRWAVFGPDSLDFGKPDFGKAVFAAQETRAGFPKLAGAHRIAAHRDCRMMGPYKAISVAAVLASRNLVLARRREQAAAYIHNSNRQAASRTRFQSFAKRSRWSGPRQQNIAARFARQKSLAVFSRNRTVER
jgi:hypothetical protein